MGCGDWDIGNLATPMYITLKDRLNQYRYLVDELSFAFLLPRDAAARNEGFVLTIPNPCNKPFFYLDFYFQANAVLRSNETNRLAVFSTSRSWVRTRLTSILYSTMSRNLTSARQWSLLT